MIFGWFMRKFSMILADFLLPGSATLQKIELEIMQHLMFVDLKLVFRSIS